MKLNQISWQLRAKDTLRKIKIEHSLLKGNVQFLFLSYLTLIWMNRMNMHHVPLSYLKHTNHRHISLTQTDLYMYSVWEKITLRVFNI